MSLLLRNGFPAQAERAAQRAVEQARADAAWRRAERHRALEAEQAARRAKEEAERNRAKRAVELRAHRIEEKRARAAGKPPPPPRRAVSRTALLASPLVCWHTSPIPIVFCMSRWACFGSFFLTLFCRLDGELVFNAPGRCATPGCNLPG